MSIEADIAERLETYVELLARDNCPVLPCLLQDVTVNFLTYKVFEAAPQVLETSTKFSCPSPDCVYFSDKDILRDIFITATKRTLEDSGIEITEFTDNRPTGNN